MNYGIATSHSSTFDVWHHTVISQIEIDLIKLSNSDFDSDSDSDFVRTELYANECAEAFLTCADAA